MKSKGVDQRFLVRYSNAAKTLTRTTPVPKLRETLKKTQIATHGRLSVAPMMDGVDLS